METIKWIKKKEQIYERLFVLLFRQMTKDNIDIVNFVNTYVKVNNECELIKNEKKEEQYINEYYKKLKGNEQTYMENLSALIALVQIEDMKLVKILNKALAINEHDKANKPS